jgi:hypothetical protein
VVAAGALATIVEEVVAAEALSAAAWALRLGDRSQLVEAPMCLLDQDI